MKDIFTVAKFTMKDMLSRKSFRISTIIILVLIVLGFNVPNIINSFSDGTSFEDKVLFVDRDHLLGELSAEYEQYPEEDGPHIWRQFTDEEINEKILNGDISSAWIITRSDRTDGISLRYVVKNRATAPQPENETIMLLQNTYAQVHLLQQGFSESEVQKVFPTVGITVEQVEEQEISGDIFVMMLMSIILFYAIYFCAYQVSSSITVEKTSKIIETLVTSTSPRNIVLGKTIGIGLVGLLQMILIVVTAIISAFLFLDPAMISSVLDLSNVTPLLGLVTLLYFILGYFMYAFAYALTGSTISKPEDIQAANTPVALLSMLGFYLAYFTLTDPTGSLNSFAALFPISSPFCMPIRMMMGLATPLEVVASLLILTVTIFIIARITIKIYSDAILNYGTRLTIGEILKMYRRK